MVELLEAFLMASAVVAVALLTWIAFRLRRAPAVYDPSTLEVAFRAGIARSSDALRGAFATSMRELGLVEDVGSIKTTAQQILNSSTSLQTLFEVKRGRAQFAEFHLEEMLREIFPPGRLHIRKKLPGFGIPDASLRTSDGIVCIDAKFPLDNYREMIETHDESEKLRRAKLFATDVRRHADKIAHDYVRPEEGGTPFALGFIPAESVYQYLAEAEPELMREAASRGVSLVSPSTLVTTMNLLSTSLRAQDIAEKAEDIEERLGRLQRGFEEFESNWKILRTHLDNAQSRMADTDRSYEKLRRSFLKVARLEEEVSETATPKSKKYW